MPKKTNPATADAKTYLHLIYALYAFSFLFGGITIIIGVILAYIQQGKKSNSLYRSHLNYLIETAWSLLFIIIITFVIFLATMMISGVFMVFPPMGAMSFFSSWMIAVLAPMLIFVWFLYRVIKGWLYLKDEREI